MSRDAKITLLIGMLSHALTWPSSGREEAANTIEQMRALGADLVNTRPRDNTTWLLYAIEQCDGGTTFSRSQIVSFLIQQGADPNQADSKGRTPFKRAMVPGTQDQTEILEVLLRNGVDPNTPDHDGWTPLMLLTTQSLAYRPSSAGPWIDERAAKAARFLLQHGADPNLVIASIRTTALHLAATKGMTQFAQVLMEHGARVDVRDSSGRRPEDIARKSGHFQCAEAIAKRAQIVDCLTDLDVMTNAAAGVSTRKIRL